MPLVSVKEEQDLRYLGASHGRCEVDVVSLPAETQVGVFVAANGDGEDAAVPTTADEVALCSGVVLYSSAADLVPESDPPAYAANKVVGVVRKGIVIVEAEGPVEKNAKAFVRFAAGAGGTVLGSVRGDDDSGTCAEFVDAVFDEALAAAGLVRLRLDIP